MNTQLCVSCLVVGYTTHVYALFVLHISDSMKFVFYFARFGGTSTSGGLMSDNHFDQEAAIYSLSTLMSITS